MKKNFIFFLILLCNCIVLQSSQEEPLKKYASQKEFSEYYFYLTDEPLFLDDIDKNIMTQQNSQTFTPTETPPLQKPYENQCWVLGCLSSAYLYSSISRSNSLSNMSNNFLGTNS